MQMGRYLNNLLLKKIGIPMVTICGLVALYLSFQHHKNAGTVSRTDKAIAERRVILEQLHVHDDSPLKPSLNRAEQSNQPVKEFHEEPNGILGVKVRDESGILMENVRHTAGPDFRDQGQFIYYNSSEKVNKVKTERENYDVLQVNGEGNYWESATVKPFEQWSKAVFRTCDDKIIGYANEFVQMYDVILDKTKFKGRSGGEELAEVLLQQEEAEYYQVDFGSLQMKCANRPDYFFNNNERYNQLFMNIETKRFSYKQVNEIKHQFHLLVIRYEYVNLYHTMTDWFNAFLLMKYLNQTRDTVNVILADAHPRGSLDPVWSKLFNFTTRLSSLKMKTFFHNLVWNIQGYNSYLLQHYLYNLPYLDEFRDFFLASYGLDLIAKTKRLNCKKIKIMFVWRRDYVAHPRNPSGSVTRQILNSKELLSKTREAFPNFKISGAQLDKYNMHHQLTHIVETDILIGMHGAGLTHALFLPKHAGLIEFIPSYPTSAGDHFMAIAQWRSLPYERWFNIDPTLEHDDKATTVPPAIVEHMINNVLVKMHCRQGNLTDISALWNPERLM